MHPLLSHMLDVAPVEGEVWDRFLTRGQRRLIVGWLGVTVAKARCLCRLALPRPR
ncbi:HD domain-containing protein [Streptomyces sp. NPDC003857]